MSLLFAHHFKECDRHKTPRRRDEWVARLVPFRILFATQDMEEIAFVECQLLGVSILRFVVVQSLNDLLRWEGLNGFGSDGERRGVLRLLVAL